MEKVSQAIILEFSDLNDIIPLSRLLVRLLLACLLGGAIGYEREQSGKNAGLRTHMLVCVGTAFTVAIPQQAGMALADLSRLIQGIMTGVGFIGAGAILKNEDHRKVSGLTTASSIWFTSAIGISVGMGRESSAILGAAVVLAILWIVPLIKPGRG